jgi:hypothetical protein
LRASWKVETGQSQINGAEVASEDAVHRDCE